MRVNTRNSVYEIDEAGRRWRLVSTDYPTSVHERIGFDWHRGFAEKLNLPGGGHAYLLSFTHELRGPVMTSRVVSEQDEIPASQS